MNNPEPCQICGTVLDTQPNPTLPKAIAVCRTLACEALWEAITPGSWSPMTTEDARNGLIYPNEMS